MNQFKSAWQFAFTHWQFFAVLAFPIFFIEVSSAYFLTGATEIMSAGNMEDLTEYFAANNFPIFILSLLSIILSMSFMGGVFVAFDALSNNKSIKPYDALFRGFRKFFPLLGAYLICFFATMLGLIMLILPAFYIGARLSLFPAYMMLENKGVMDSISSSWESTDEHGTTLFLLTLVFFTLTSVVAAVVALVSGGSDTESVSVLTLVLSGLVEYIFIFPWAYVYYSLYQSLKTA